MRFYVTIKRWSHLMLPSNKQIPQSLAKKFKITLKRLHEGVGVGVGGFYPQACSTEELKILEVPHRYILLLFFLLYSRSVYLFNDCTCECWGHIKAKAFVRFSLVFVHTYYMFLC